MMIELLFDPDKVRKENMKLEDCYGIIDDFIEENGGLKKINRGVYQGESQEAFDTIMKSIGVFINTDWFLRTIKAWYCREEGNKREDRVDYLQKAAKWYPDKAKRLGFSKSSVI